MRVRLGDHQESHGKDLRCYQFVSDGSLTPTQILASCETATGLSLGGHDGDRHGYVLTSPRPDGSRYVAVVLYEACGGCELHAEKHVRAPDLTPQQLQAISQGAAEHPAHKLTGGPNDEAVLNAIGMGMETHPHLHGGK